MDLNRPTELIYALEQSGVAPQSARMLIAYIDRLESEVERLKDAEHYWTDESYRAKFERLGAAGEAYFQELRGQTAELTVQLAASHAEVTRLREALRATRDVLSATMLRAGGAYDWNADPDSMTLAQGHIFSVIDPILRMDQQKDET